MGRPRDCLLSEVIQTDKDNYNLISHKRGIKKIIQMNLLTKQEQTHRFRK